jgi:hypothetical protein
MGPRYRAAAVEERFRGLAARWTTCAHRELWTPIAGAATTRSKCDDCPKPPCSLPTSPPRRKSSRSCCGSAGQLSGALRPQSEQPDPLVELRPGILHCTDNVSPQRPTRRCRRHRHRTPGGLIGRRSSPSSNCDQRRSGNCPDACLVCLERRWDTLPRSLGRLRDNRSRPSAAEWDVEMISAACGESSQAVSVRRP